MQVCGRPRPKGPFRTGMFSGQQVAVTPTLTHNNTKVILLPYYILYITCTPITWPDAKTYANIAMLPLKQLCCTTMTAGKMEPQV